MLPQVQNQMSTCDNLQKSANVAPTSKVNV